MTSYVTSHDVRCAKILVDSLLIPIVTKFAMTQNAYITLMRKCSKIVEEEEEEGNKLKREG